MKINSYIRKRQRNAFKTLYQQNAATSYSLIEQHQSQDCGWNISTLLWKLYVAEGWEHVRAISRSGRSTVHF